MCVTGEEWLRHTFDPALRTSSPPYERLHTELGALSQSGELSEDEAARARARLDEDEIDRQMIVRRRTERLLADSRRVGGTQDRLEGRLTPERPLGDVDGITVVLTVVELWTSRLVLRLEAPRNELTDALDATFHAERKAWERRLVEQRTAAEVDDLPPPKQASFYRFLGLPYPWRMTWAPATTRSSRRPAVLSIPGVQSGALNRGCLRRQAC